MKAVIKKPSNEILISDITDEHIVVSVIDGYPTILSRPYRGNNFSFLSISNGITFGNGFAYNNNRDSISKIVESEINIHNAHVEVFGMSDWKQALQWLIDNA